MTSFKPITMVQQRIIEFIQSEYCILIMNNFIGNFGTCKTLEKSVFRQNVAGCRKRLDQIFRLLLNI